MRIALTGTPGVGKSAVALELARHAALPAIEVYDLARQARAIRGYDRARRTWVADLKRLRTASKKLKNVIIVGHLSHFCAADFIFVLRTNPKVLAARLKRKRWSKKKIQENVEAETIDVILQEAVKLHPRRKIFEIDTTRKTAAQAAAIILKIVWGNKLARKKFAPGKIDWSGYIGEV